MPGLFSVIPAPCADAASCLPRPLLGSKATHYRLESARTATKIALLTRSSKSQSRSKISRYFRSSTEAKCDAAGHLQSWEIDKTRCARNRSEERRVGKECR